MRTTVSYGIIFFIVTAVFFFSCSENEDEAIKSMVAYDPANPLLATVGDLRIDKKYFETSLHLLPPGLFEIYSNPKKYRDLLQEIIVQEIYNRDGVYRGYDTKPGYVSLVESTRRMGLVEYALEKEVLKDTIPDDKYLREVYDKNLIRFQKGNGQLLPFEEIKSKLYRNVLREKMEERLASAGKKLEQRFSVRYNLELLKPGNEKSNKPVVESGIMTWTPMDFAQKAADAGLLKTLTSYEGRVNTLKRLVWERLFHDNALADEIDKEDEFVRRMDVLSRYMLANFTKNEIIGDHIFATTSEAMAYYDLHLQVSKDAKGNVVPFADVKEKAKELATIQKRNDVLTELSQSISRNRFEPVIYEENCDRLWGK